ncbi:MAG TPA: CGNR zinc finger domain-containing protein [Nakamurella sp.]|nr:CGNR zinc finger domain-containing protein [Nakamurella sp.]
MLFAHDTEVALAAAAALVNTGGQDEDLPDVAALDEFVRTWGWTGERRRDQAELRAVRDLRPRLRRIWEVDQDEVVKILNALLRDARALPQLVKHDEWNYHLHATPPAAPLATRMAVEAAMALVDVVRGDELSRLQICEYPGCHNVVIDLSKNRSKRFCEDGCGNRAAVAAYRARKMQAAALDRGGRG